MQAGAQSTSDCDGVEFGFQGTFLYADDILSRPWVHISFQHRPELPVPTTSVPSPMSGTKPRHLASPVKVMRSMDDLPGCGDEIGDFFHTD